GRVLVKVKVEAPGLPGLYWNFHRFNASDGAPYGPLLSCEPTKKLGLPTGGGLIPSRSLGNSPSPTTYAGVGGARKETIVGLGLPASAWGRSSAYAPTPAKLFAGSNSRVLK